ncbi:MAG: hypothetical protein E5W55_04405, partial [Mesorhizobium sp.]
MHALDQISYPRCCEFHAIAVTAESETDFRFPSDIGIVYPLLDDRRCLGVSGQALAAWVAQHHDAPHLELASVLLFNGVDEAPVTKPCPQNLTSKFLPIVHARDRYRGNRRLKHAHIAAGAAVVEEMLPVPAQFGERLPADDALALFVLDREFTGTRGVAHHGCRPDAAAIGGKLDHRRLASSSERRKPSMHWPATTGSAESNGAAL